MAALCVPLIFLLLYCNVIVLSPDSAQENEEPPGSKQPADSAEDSRGGVMFMWPAHFKEFKLTAIANIGMFTRIPFDLTDINPLHLTKLSDETENETENHAGNETGNQTRLIETTHKRLIPESTSANGTNTTKAFKVKCADRILTGDEVFTVKLFNSSQTLRERLQRSSTHCSVVLFYTPTCPFSTKLAPHFNALPRVFPRMHFFALNPLLDSRFKMRAVPAIFLYQGSRARAKYNASERTLESFIAFIYNQTGFLGDPNVTVTDADLIGPIPTTPVKTFDWHLVFSSIFVFMFCVYAILFKEDVGWFFAWEEEPRNGVNWDLE